MLAVSRDLILAIDNGPQSLRALLFVLQGALLAKARVLLNATVDNRTRATKTTSHSPEQVLYFKHEDILGHVQSSASARQ